MTAKLTLLLLAVVGLTACGRSAPNQRAEAEMPTLDVTHWTDTDRAVHGIPASGDGTLSALRRPPHEARRTSRRLMPARRRSSSRQKPAAHRRCWSGPKPSRPGAFRVEDVPPAPGRYRWALVLDAPGLSDRHDLGTITVFPDEQAARADAEKRPPDDAAAIAYLKEQQWTNAFATARVVEAEVRASIRVPATVHPLPGGEAIVAAPAAGRFTTDDAALDRHSCSRGPDSGPPGPTSLCRSRSRDARSRCRRSAGGRRSCARRTGTGRRSARRASGSGAPSRGRTPDDDRRRGAVASRRGQAGAARRNTWHRRGRRCRQRVRPARPDRRSIGGGDGDFGCFIRGGRAALPDRADGPRRAGSPGPFCRRGPRQAGDRTRARDSRHLPAARARATPRARLGRDGSDDPRVGPSDGDRKPGRATPGRADGSALLYTRDRRRVPAVPSAAVLMEADGRTSSSRSAARVLRADSSRSPRVTAISWGSGAACLLASESSRGARTRCSWRPRHQDCPLKATFTEVHRASSPTRSNNEAIDPMVD